MVVVSRDAARGALAPLRWAVLALALAACGNGHSPVATNADSHEVGVNDNRRPAGTLHDGALTLRLVIGEGTWHPEKAFEYRILAFGEQGQPLVTPGPLIRVREGTLVHVTITNSLAKEVEVHGLFDHGAAPPAPLHVPAHGTATAEFRTGPAGTYYYWGTTGGGIRDRSAADSQLTGALIVDGPGEAPPDRVFVIGDHGAERDPPPLVWVINGRSWPDTERLTYTVGEPVRWRWINASGSGHPLHLHGTYFRVNASGDGVRDQPLAPEQQHQVSTEVLQLGGTIALEWSPEKPGNWLFHCHILDHVVPDNRLPAIGQWYDEYANLPHDQHMSGLVLGITALPAATTATRETERRPRRLTLHVAERSGVHYQGGGLSGPGLGYSLDDGPVTAPGPALVLERGAPVEITIINQIRHATTVHWHGIELESYYDGVAHFSGNGHDHTPHLMPGDTFVAKFTPPRAGTFIYHTHFNDYAQLSTGLYGALIVVDTGKRFDPETDHVFVISRDGFEYKDPLLLNGSVEPAPVVLRAGLPHRLRLIGITPTHTVRVRLLRDGRPITWRAVAKDGADLPPALATRRSAEIPISPGETYDFEIGEAEPGQLSLEAVEAREQGSHRATAQLSIVAN